jgi:hypothetical protein
MCCCEQHMVGLFWHDCMQNMLHALPANVVTRFARTTCNASLVFARISSNMQRSVAGCVRMSVVLYDASAAVVRTCLTLHPKHLLVNCSAQPVSYTSLPAYSRLYIWPNCCTAKGLIAAACYTTLV